MRVALLSTLAVVGLACGGEKKGDTTPAGAPPAAQPQAAPQPAAAAPSAPLGPVVEVKMTGNGTSKAAFEPRALTIAPGTTVRFVNVSGGPHNIAFSADSVPKGGAEALKQGMPNPLTDLASPFLTQPNEHYDVSFVGAPAGVYKGSCQPHAQLGMRIAITVK